MTTIRNIRFIALITIAGLLTSSPASAQDLPTRYPLLELFTNTPCPICGSQNPGLFNRLENYESEYHQVSFYPGSPYTSCVFYQANISENQARKSFYTQIFGSPTVVINGTDFSNSNGVTNTVLDNVTGGTSWLSVEVTETSGTTRDVTIKLVDHVGGSVDAGRLFAVIVEGEVMYDAPNGEDVHYNVFRKFLTPTDGINVDMTSGQATRTYQYEVDDDWRASQVYVVAWLMNPETMEVYNSGTRFDETTTSTRNVVENLKLRVYPNPAHEQVVLELPSSGEGTLYIHDAQGRRVHQQAVDSRTPVTIPVGTWIAGSYFVEAVLDSGVAKGRFEVVR